MAKKKSATKAKEKEKAPTPIDLDTLSRPPIIERYVDFQIDLKESHFEKEIPEWLASVSAEHDYPEQIIRKHWLFRIEGTEDNVRPVGSLYEIPRIQKMSANGKLVKAIEIVPSIIGASPRLRFQQGRPGKKVCRFTDLEKEVRTLLPDLVEKVAIEKIEGLWLSYRNELTEKRYPEFVKDGHLKFGEILQFFNTPQVQLGSCISPLSAEFSTKIQNLTNRFLRFSIEDSVGKNENALQMLLEYNGLKEDSRSVDAALEELSIAHGIILDAFRRHFTPEALKIFSQ